MGWKKTGQQTHGGNERRISVQLWKRGRGRKTPTIRKRRVERRRKERRREVRETCVPLGSHHRRLSPFRNSACSCRFREVITHTQLQIQTHTRYTHTHYLSLTHTHALMLWAVLWTDPCHWRGTHREPADNNIILWPSYGNMVLLLWRNMNIMAFRGSLGNYMAVMVLNFNRIFRFPIYLGSRGGKSIKLFTFAMICAGMLYIHTYEYAQRQKCLEMPLNEGHSSVG